jgi:hypothetical protein
MDCQLDTFLHAYGLYHVFKNRNLKLEKKLEFLQASGIFTSRTLSRLNSIRNKMEHAYEIPKIDDIEIYYDLVWAFVAVLQRTSVILQGDSDLQFVVYDNGDMNDKNMIGKFRIEYSSIEPSVKAYWMVDNLEYEVKSDLTYPEEFASFFKICVLLHELYSFASNHYVASQLKTHLLTEA